MRQMDLSYDRLLIKLIGLSNVTGVPDVCSHSNVCSSTGPGIICPSSVTTAAQRTDWFAPANATPSTVSGRITLIIRALINDIRL